MDKGFILHIIRKNNIFYYILITPGLYQNLDNTKDCKVFWITYSPIFNKDHYIFPFFSGGAERGVRCQF